MSGMMIFSDSDEDEDDEFHVGGDGSSRVRAETTHTFKEREASRSSVMAQSKKRYNIQKMNKMGIAVNRVLELATAQKLIRILDTKYQLKTEIPLNVIQEVKV